VYLVLGYLFTLWFVHKFLHDRKFSDSDKEPGPVMLFMLTVCGPLMAVIMGVTLSLQFVFDEGRDFIRRLYFLDPTE
jgi:hypothetical protein